MQLKSFFLFFMISLAAFYNGVETSAQTFKLDEGQIDFLFAPPVKFSPGGDLARLRFLPDGRLYAAARFQQGLGAATPIYRFLPNGQRDTTFNAPVVRINDFQLLPDGKILYADVFSLDSYQMARIVRLNADGAIDTTFRMDVQIAGEIFNILPLSNGKILISGLLTEKNEQGFVKYVARLNADGSIDRSFGGDGAFNGNTMVAQSDGRIVISRSGSIVRLTADGAPDPSFNAFALPNTFLRPRIFNAAGGKLIVNAPPAAQIVRLNPDGTVDPTFVSQASSSTGNIEVESDGDILVGVASTTPLRSQFERLSPDGALIGRFTTFVGGAIYVDPTDTIYLATDSIINGTQRGVVKLHKKYQPTRRKAFDFDGDGKSDIAVFRPSDGVWYVLNSATGTFSFTRFGSNGDRPVSADYDGDGKADIAIYRPSDGMWYRLFSSNGQSDAVRFGLPDDVPVQNDFDGDGRDDIALFRPSTGIWYRLNSADGSFAAFQFGLSGDKPLAGDYDGDAKADFAVYRPSDSNWYRYSSIDGSYKVDNVGFYDGNVGTPADYDGDNRLDLAYYQDVTGSWYGLKSASGGGIYLRWGASGDVPVPADYDGDSRDDIAVWRPADGSWWIIRSSDNQSFSYRFGAPGDIPVQAAYVR